MILFRKILLKVHLLVTFLRTWGWETLTTGLHFMVSPLTRMLNIAQTEWLLRVMLPCLVTWRPSRLDSPLFWQAAQLHWNNFI